MRTQAQNVRLGSVCVCVGGGFYAHFVDIMKLCVWLFDR